MILVKVDFPAPLSPANATTSPARRVKSTRSSACTPPKRLDKPRTSSTGSCGWSLIDASSAEAPLALVDQHRDDDHHAHRDELPERLDIEEHQAVLDHRDDQRADDGAGDGAGAAEQAGAADHHGGDAVEQQR